MNGKIKIYSRAILLGRYSSMLPVIAITLLLTLIFNNLFFFGEPIINLPPVKNFLASSQFPLLKDIILFSFAVITGAISFLVLSPFRFGQNIWFFESAKKNRLSVKKIFLFYRPRFSRSCIALRLRTSLLKISACLVFLIPSVTLGSYAFYELGKGVSVKLFVFLCVFTFVLALIGLFFAFVFSQKYFLSDYLFFENSAAGIGESIKLSSQIMDSECFRTAFFKLSFIPWFLLCIFIFPAVYVYPYYKTAVSFKAVSMLSNTKENNC